MDRVLTLSALPQPRRQGLLSLIVAAAALRRQRRDLGALDEHLLRDVGLTRGEALREADRPVWDAPGHWLA